MRDSVVTQQRRETVKCIKPITAVYKICERVLVQVDQELL